MLKKKTEIYSCFYSIIILFVLVIIARSPQDSVLGNTSSSLTRNTYRTCNFLIVYSYTDNSNKSLIAFVVAVLRQELLYLKNFLLLLLLHLIIPSHSQAYFLLKSFLNQLIILSPSVCELSNIEGI